MKTKTEIGYSIHGGHYNSAYALDKEGLENILTQIIYNKDVNNLRRLYGENTVNAIIDGFENYLADHYDRIDLFRMGVYGNIKAFDEFIRDISIYVDSEFITVTVYSFTEQDEKELEAVASCK